MSKAPFRVSDRVVHFQYGLGTIAAVEQARTIIDFDRNGRKKFVTAMMQLEHTDIEKPADPPPGARRRKTPAKPRK